MPQTLEKRLEIINAIRAFTAPDGDGQFRKRQVEIAALRRQLEKLTQDVLELWRQCEPRARSYVLKYNPDEPRVPAGNTDGGQWTSEGGSESADESDNGSERNNASRPVQYAALDVGTRTGASVGGDDPISAKDIPTANPKHPVPFVDSAGKPVTDEQGNPLLRPADLPPEVYVSAGLASNLGDLINAYKQGEETGESEQNIEAEGGLVTIAELELLPFRQNGSLDAERVNEQYVVDYHDYANIAIGLFMAAAGVSLDDALSIADAYAELKSSFNGPKDQVYTHSLKADVEDMKIGYELYRSGRISVGQ